jgi:septum site-determining protein MinD
MTTYVAILSAKGGVGKTTTAINLTCALSQFGRDVILVDGNYTKPNVGLQLGITNMKKHLHHSLKGKAEINEAIHLHPSGVKVIPGSIVYEEIYAQHNQTFKELMKKLDGYAEVVIIDGPAGFTQELTDIISASDKILLVTTPDLSAITDTLKTKRVCDERKCEVMGVIVTHVMNKEYEATAENIQTMFDSPVVGEIPHDEQIKVAQSKKYPVVFADLTTPATIAYKRLAAALIGETYEPDIAKENLFDYILQKLGFR